MERIVRVSAHFTREMHRENRRAQPKLRDRARRARLRRHRERRHQLGEADAVGGEHAARVSRYATGIAPIC